MPRKKTRENQNDYLSHRRQRHTDEKRLAEGFGET